METLIRSCDILKDELGFAHSVNGAYFFKNFLQASLPTIKSPPKQVSRAFTQPPSTLEFIERAPQAARLYAAVTDINKANYRGACQTIPTPFKPGVVYCGITTTVI